jgi:hypothetical protein
MERAIEMFKSGEGSDFVIEVQQSEGEEKVLYCLFNYVYRYEYLISLFR